MSNIKPQVHFLKYTDGWNKVKLKDIADQGKSHSLTRSIETTSNTKCRYVHYGDIHTSDRNIITSDNQLPRIEPGSYSLLRKGDIVIADASEDYDDIGKPSVINYTPMEKIVAGLHTIVLKPDRRIINPLYLYYVLTSQTYKDFLKIKATGTKVIGISYSQLKEFEFYIPSLDEQTEISKSLLKIDNILHKIKSQKIKLIQLKQAMLQKMFPKEGETVPEIRFDRFEENWRRSHFFENIKKTIDFRGRTPKKLGMNWSQGGYLALSALNVKNGYVDSSLDSHYGDEALYNKWMRGNELKKGQVLFTTEAPMGNVAQVPDNKGYILSQRTIAFEVEEDKIIDEFLVSLLQSSTVKDDLMSFSSGGTAKGVSQKSLSKLKVTVPESLFEQKLIGNYFKELNKNIAYKQKELVKLRQYKQAMLDKMFV